MRPSLAPKIVWLAVLSTASLAGVASAQQRPDITDFGRDGRLTWTSEAGVSYQVQKTPQLVAGGWTNVGTALSGTGAPLSIVDSNRTTAQAFYRIVATNSAPCTNTGGATCAQAFYLGAFSGDSATSSGFQCNNHPCYPGPTRSGCGSAWFRVLLREDSNCPAFLRIYVRLEVPAGADYDLYLYHGGCSGVAAASSTAGAGQTENLTHVINDDFDGGDDSTDLFIEVRARNSVPGTWTLRMSGGTGPCF